MSITYSDYIHPSAGTDPPSAAPRGLLLLDGLLFNLAESMNQCLSALERSGLQAYPQLEPLIGGDSPGASKWCNATWDSVICWPATPANSSITLPCPPLKGLDPTSGVWKLS